MDHEIAGMRRIGGAAPCRRNRPVQSASEFSYVERLRGEIGLELNLEIAGRLADLLVDPRLTAQEDDWLSVVLTDAVRPEDPMARLRTRFPHVLVLDWQPAGVSADERTYGARVAGRDDLDVVTEFVRHVRGTDAGPAERDLLRRALVAARGGEDG